jgi:hypothetical protein
MFERHFSEERYINPLTDFGFKRLFGTEPNKALLIDFLNVVLPECHQIEDLTYGNSETVGNTPLDRRFLIFIAKRLGTIASSSRSKRQSKTSLKIARFITPVFQFKSRENGGIGIINLHLCMRWAF